MGPDPEHVVTLAISYAERDTCGSLSAPASHGGSAITPAGEAAATEGAAAASPGNSPAGSRRARPAPRYPAPPTSHPGFAGLWLTSGLPSCKVYPHRVRVPLRGAAGAPPVHGASDPLRFHLVDGHPHRLRAPATGRRRRNALTAPGEAGTTLILAPAPCTGNETAAAARRDPFPITPNDYRPHDGSSIIRSCVRRMRGGTERSHAPRPAGRSPRDGR